MGDPRLETFLPTPAGLYEAPIFIDLVTTCQSQLETE